MISRILWSEVVWYQPCNYFQSTVLFWLHNSIVAWMPWTAKAYYRKFEGGIFKIRSYCAVISSSWVNGSLTVSDPLTHPKIMINLTHDPLTHFRLCSAAVLPCDIFVILAPSANICNYLVMLGPRVGHEFFLPQLAAQKVDHSAAEWRRRCRQPESSGGSDGAPPSQPKLSAAAAAEIFTARRKWGQNSCTVKHQQ